MNLYVLLALLGLGLGALAWAFIAGRRWGQASNIKAENDAAIRIADAVGNAPATRDVLVDRLRRGGGL